MLFKNRGLGATAAVVLSVLTACNNPFSSESGDKDGGTAGLYVKFENETASTFTITDIRLMGMGAAGSGTPVPSGTWTDNIVASGDSIAPGAHRFFTVAIPAGECSQFRLGVRDSTGQTVLLHEQANFPAGVIQGYITHWGSDERTVSVTVVRDGYSGVITTTGYSDWAGIQ